MRGVAGYALGLVGIVLVGPATAEPRFLAKQYTRCTTCHVSPAGGGLLTDYGRSLSHRELSTTGDRSGASPDPSASPGEEAFLWGALGQRLGPVALGIELRPSHLRFASGDVNSSRTFMMAANVHGTVQLGEWTAYGQAGREPDAGGGGSFVSYEHWVGRLPASGLGVRAGRFLPAYGVRFADHTAYNRSWLRLAQHDQIYGVEVSHSTDRLLTQVAVGPGRADALIDDDGSQAVMATARVQVDLGPRTAVAVSALHEGASDVGPSRTAGGVALGLAPVSRLATWTQLDRQVVAGRAAYYLVHETSVEAYRGIWLTLSPQFRLGTGRERSDLQRLAVGAVLLPRTHVSVTFTYYRDRFEQVDTSNSLVLSQLHLYF